MKKLVFRGNEFFGERINKTESSIIFIANDREINRLTHLSQDLSEYRIYNEDGSVGTFDDVFHEDMLTTATDTMRLIYALLKENTTLKTKLVEVEGRIKKLEGGTV